MTECKKPPHPSKYRSNNMICEIEKQLIDKYDELNRHMDVLNADKDRELTRWLYLNEYQKGIRFALDLIKREGSNV